jgi:hypothetical protein
MTVLLIALQIALPVLLLAWLAAFPASGVVAYTMHAVATGSVLLALGLVAMWAMPPWWVPHLYGLAFAGIVAWQLATGRISGTGLWSAGWTATTGLVLLAALGGYGAYLSAQALAGRQLPEVGTVNIAAPFAAGTYIVAHGGSTEAVNAHLHTLDESIERFRPWRGQSLAVDIIRVFPSGLRADGWRPADPARYATFGTPLLAPCAGTVTVAVDGLPDMPVPEMECEHLPGNFVVIDCGGFAVALAHMRRGSVLVEHGDEVQVGDPIGEMGNSGNSSEPHLHIHAQRGIPEGAPFGGEPLGLTIDGRFLVRNDRISADTQ